MTENLCESWTELAKVADFKCLQTSEILALKAPVAMSGVHFVWGKVTADSIKSIKDFFGITPIAWALNKDQEIKEVSLLEAAGFEKTYIYHEMEFDLNMYKRLAIAPEITVKQVDTIEELALFSEIAAEVFGLLKNDVLTFLKPILLIKNQPIFMAYWQGIPAATAMTYLGSRTAGVYFVSVKKEFRRKGLAFAITQTCLEKAHDHRLSKVVLYASDTATLLYQKIGFKTIYEYHEYSFPKSSSF